MMLVRIVVVVILVFASLFTRNLNARTLADPQNLKNRLPSFTTFAPAHCMAAHRVGKIELAVANNGTFGKEYHPGEESDCFTGESITQSCQYPKGSNISYLFGGAFWIGAVVGRDTLVSVGADGWQLLYEMYPDEAPFGDMVYRTTLDPEQRHFEDAVSEEDYVAVYTDTFTDGVDNDFFGRQHVPLNIAVKQSSYAWSYAYAEDFVLFDYQISNVGERPLEQVYMGIYVDAMICYDCFGSNQGFQDDLSGFLHTYPSTYGACGYIDTVFMAWQADNDGDRDIVFGDGRHHPCPHVVATRIVRTPAQTLDVSFNWWIGNGDPSLDFGPRERSGAGRSPEPFRDFRTGGLGTPEGDVNKYYILRNEEFDYDQIFTASIQPGDSLWLYPNQDLAANFADGYDTRYLLSFGPFDIDPGETLPISFAYIAGEDVHQLPGNVDNLPDKPRLYLDNLDFSDLALNATWASWVYDNPGVDTDGDGYFGKWRICCSESSIVSIDTLSTEPPEYDTNWRYTICDTIFYEGDGVPDFRGAAPPPAPEFRLDPGINSITVRFNGTRSETTKDIFLHEVDFEGYRVYIGRDDRPTSFSLIASYDLNNFDKYTWLESRQKWVLLDPPFTLEQLRCLYGDSCRDFRFDPLDYGRSARYVLPDYPDSQFYFVAHGYNVSALGLPTGIEKVYPDQPYPGHLNPDSARPDELTEAGALKYFEYEYTVTDLLATVPYWINVTAFDFGSPGSGLSPLESSVSVGTQYAFPLIPAANNDPTGGKIKVYPNPYRIDAHYRQLGYEGRSQEDRPDNRVRRVHFANLPPRCTIKILSLDGDLIKEISHDMNPADPNSTHDSWDLITRNTQLVASGLYYWTVEDESGHVQIGKLVIIM